MAFAVIATSVKTKRPVDEPDTVNYGQARRSANSELWKAAEQEELRSLESNKTWNIVVRLNGAKPLPTKWVYKTKKLGNGDYDKMKARLVGRGDFQIKGGSYILTYSTVISMVSIRIIVIFSIIWRVPARYGDVPSAYVKASLEADYKILLKIPPGMEISAATLKKFGVNSTGELTLELERSIYGLKQSGRLWNELLVSTLITLGFEQCITDSCVFYKLDGRETVLVGAYVDDLIATGTTTGVVDQFFTDMLIELKDLGVLSKFLGMHFLQCDDGSVKIDQEQTIIEMLDKYDLSNLNGVRVPIENKYPTSPGDLTPLPDKCTTLPKKTTIKEFQSLAGSLLWLTRCTRPDIAFAVHKITRRCHAPTVGDWKLAKRVARYISGTRATFLHMKPDDGPTFPLRLVSYTDADFTGDVEDRKSISAGIQFVNGVIAGWQCRKQTAVALSTVEAEFVSAAAGGEILGIKELMMEIGMQVKTPVVLRIDNKAAIQQIDNEAASANGKHVDIKLKFLRDYSAKGKMKTEFTDTRTMVADLLTKALPVSRLQELCEAIGLVLNH